MRHRRRGRAQDAEAGKDGGFKNPAFVEAGKQLKELSDLEPFQEGWLGTLFPASAGMFGDGKGAMDLMGNWLLGMQGENAADGKGFPPDQTRHRFRSRRSRAARARPPTRSAASAACW